MNYQPPRISSFRVGLVFFLASSISCDAVDGIASGNPEGTTTTTTTTNAGDTGNALESETAGVGGSTGETTPSTGEAETGGAAEDATGSTTGGETDGVSVDTDSTGLSEYDVTYASITSVEVGLTEDGENRFSIGVLSPDTGCEQYANWWEIVSEEGELIFRRILTHSHVPPTWKQPFVRQGDPVEVGVDQVVVVRAHMNTSGFGYHAYRGSISAGFEPFETDELFAADLDVSRPQPGLCPF